MYQVSRGQKETLCKYWKGQELDALILGAKRRGHKYGVQQDIEWLQLISLGTSFCFTYSLVKPSGSGKGNFHGRPQHRGGLYQLHVEGYSQIVLWG